MKKTVFCKTVTLFLMGLSSSVFGMDICLSLIVRNEAEHIEKCLESAKDLVSFISVVDAGSTDKTLEIIEQFLAKTNIPGKIHKSNGKSSDYNKHLSVESAQQALQEKGYKLNETYLLCLSGDMTVHIKDSFRRENLKEDGYLLLENSKALSCYSYNLRLLRASIPWKSYRSLQDSWIFDAVAKYDKLDSLVVEDLGNNQERLKSDIETIKDDLVQHPNNQKDTFYLAQSLRTLRQFNEAIEWYKKRIDQEGDREEIWFSKYMLGECYREQGNWEDALFWFLEAYQYNPERADPLLAVANYYRLRAQNDLAYVFASFGSTIPRPKDQILFREAPDSNYRFNEELSIAAFYTKFREQGFNAVDDLVVKRGVPWHVRTQAYKNLLFYVQNLPNSRLLPIMIDLPLIEKGQTERYHPMNPSILKTTDGYKVICRTVNYTQTGAKLFHTIDANGIFRTKNFLVNYDQKFNVLSQMEIVEDLPRKRIRSWIASNIKGLDDCRIFDLNGSPWFTCTTSDTNPTGNFQISLCHLAENGSGRLNKLVPLIGPDLNRCEKNWLPFVEAGELMMIYSYDPFVIYKPNLETGQCQKLIEYKPSLDFSSFRGSAAPISFDGGYLMVVHEVVHMDDHTRRYLHRFLYLDREFKIRKLSKPFIFKQMGIEFCCAMTLDHSGNELILSLGVEDREAYLCFVDLETVRSLLSRSHSD